MSEHEPPRGRPRRRRSRFFDGFRRMLLRATSEGLNLTETRVLLALFAHADTRTGECWPSVRTLSRFAGCPSRLSRVRDALRVLHERGFVATVNEGGGRGRRTVRRLVLDSEREDGSSLESGDRNGGRLRAKGGTTRADETGDDSRRNEGPSVPPKYQRRRTKRRKERKDHEV